LRRSARTCAANRSTPDSSDRTSIEQLLGARTVAVDRDDAKLFSVVDNLEEDFVILRADAPSSGLGGPDDATAFDPASIGPNEIVDWPTVRVTCMIFGSRSINAAIAVRQIASASKAGAADTGDGPASNNGNAIRRKAKCISVKPVGLSQARV
jgi:hypothetical protein